MKALVLHGPGKYSFEADWPIPEAKGAWALVRVAYAGVCGSDLPRFEKTGSYKHPMILGHEFSGTVEKPASGSQRFKGGERVAIMPIMPCGECHGCRKLGPFHCTHYQFLGSRDDGGFAEYVLVPEENLFVLPSDLDIRLGAFLEPLAVGLHVVRQSEFRAGKSALVFGAGGIGLVVAQWLSVFGAERVVVADLREVSRDLAGKCGIRETIDPTSPSFADLGLFDYVFEAAGSAQALATAIERVVPKGTITVVGRDTKDLNLSLASFEKFMRKEARLHGCWGYDLGGEEKFVYKALADGRFVLEPMITHVYRLEDSVKAIGMMLGKSEYYGKVLLDCR